MNSILQSNKVVIIAELSCNHAQNFDVAVRTIEAIKAAGAEYVKVQNDNPDGGITINCDNKYFKIDGGTLWDGETLFSLYKKTYTPWEWLPKLKEVAENLGLGFFSTPSDLQGVDFLEELDICAYKIASFEINDTQLIKYAASKNKPIILSTGIAREEDIIAAISACREVNNNQIALLKCTSSYPTKLDEANLLTIPDMKNRFNVTVGVSDHSLGSIVPTVATALGARIIEKHFILDRSLGGPDAAFSMEPKEFSNMVQSVRDAEKTLGVASYKLSPKGEANRKFARSLFIIKDVKKGEIITNNNVSSIRPSDGLPPCQLENVIGKTFKADYEKGTPLSWDLINK